MNDKAIHADADDQETGAQGSPANKRLSMMDSISRNRVQNMAEDNEIKVEDIIHEGPIDGYADPTDAKADKGAEEGADPGEKGEIKPDAGEEDKTAAAGEDKAGEVDGEHGEKKDYNGDHEEEETSEVVSLSSGEIGRYKVKVKVDGEEQELSLSEVTRGFQKDAAASKRLEQAAQRQKELDEREEKIKAREAELAADPATKIVDEEGNELNPESSLPGVDGEAIKGFLDAFYGGKEDDAAAALTRLLQSTGRTSEATQGKEVDTGNVAEIVKQVLTEDRDQQNFNVARHAFTEEYEDVWKDPNLARMADDFYAEEIELGASYAEAFTNSGNRVREWVASIAGADSSSNSKDDKHDERTEKKKDLDNLSGNGETSSGKAAEEAPKGPSATIQEMAQSRGAHRRMQ